MCPGRQVNRCGGSPCTAVTATCTEQAAAGFDSQRRAVSLSHPSEQTHPEQQVPPRCPSVVLWTPCSGVEWGVSNRPSGFGEAARRASSLRTWWWRVRRSPCPSCPTTHPPYVPRPSAVDHLDETC